MTGLIVKGIAGFYYVKTEDGVFQCKARGIFRKDGITPMVGDFVKIDVLSDGSAVIETIEERKNAFIRPPVSNVDCFIVTVATAKPEPNFKTTDRFLALAEKNNAKAVICVNKIDIEAEKALTIREIYGRVYPVICVSALTGAGIGELKALFKDGKYAFAGPSGVGKSTLIMAIEPAAAVETGEISRKTKRGKHTTRHAEIFETGYGAFVYDTPGFTAIDTARVSADELQHLFPEIAELYGKCKYRNCFHIKEAGCAVRDAVKTGAIHRSRYDSYSEMCEGLIRNQVY